MGRYCYIISEQDGVIRYDLQTKWTKNFKFMTTWETLREINTREDILKAWPVYFSIGGNCLSQEYDTLDNPVEVLYG